MEEKDRISELPDEILHQILSSLPIKDKVQTSVLAKSWLHLWSSNPTIDFSDFTINFSNKDIIAAVHRHLHQSGSTIDVLCLQLDLGELDFDNEISYYISILDKWIHRADERSLSNLKLLFGDSPFSYNEELPLSLFCCKSLSLLKLRGCRFHIPSHGLVDVWGKLKSLHLVDIQTADDTLASILSAATVLEDLFLVSVCGLTKIGISHRNGKLKQLVLVDLGSSCHVVIADAPCLRSILYTGNLSNIVVEEIPSLGHVGIFSSFEGPFPLGLDWDFLLKIPHIHSLTLNIPFLCTENRRVGDEVDTAKF